MGTYRRATELKAANAAPLARSMLRAKPDRGQSAQVLAALRGGATEESEPQQGVLWHGDEPPELLAQLRRMTIINSVPGRNDFVAVIENENQDRAYFLEDGSLKPLVPDLSTCLVLMIQYAGAEGLLAHLVRADWEDRLERDPRLAWLRNR